MQTFASGEEVNEVHIVNDLNTGGATDVLSAEQGKVLNEKLNISTTIISIDLSSPYFLQTLEGVYMGGAGGKIIQNQYTDNYRVSLFKFPEGNYKGIKKTSSTSFGALVATFTSVDDFVVNGTPNSVIIKSSNTTQGQEIEFEFEEETLVAIEWNVNEPKFKSYVEVQEIQENTVKDAVVQLQQDVEDLESEVDSMDIAGLTEDVDLLKEAVLTNEYISIDRTSPYFVDRITGAYIAHSTITQNQYTGLYLVDLFRLPAGKYRFSKLNGTSSNGYLVAKIASVDDFVVGGSVITPSILKGADANGTIVELTFEEETLVVLANRTDFNYYYYCTADEIDIVSSISQQVEESVSQAFSENLDIVIPDTVYAIVGTELNIWNDTVSLSIDKGLQSPMNYQIRWNCNKGLITDRCFRFNPTVSDVGNVSCTCYIYDVRGKFVSSKTFTIKVLANNALNTAKNIVYFGDSLGAGAATALYNNFNDSNRFGGTIPTMLGTHGTSNHYEAVGGDKWSSYASSGSTGYRIYVSGVTSMSVGAVYSDGSHTFEVYEVNITEGTGNCLLGKYYTNPGTLIMPSGTLTKVSGSGDSTVPYTGAFQESVNPLWNDTTSQLDINQYKQTLVSLGQLSSVNDKIDAVSFQFGINDAYLANNLTTLHTYISDLYDCFVNDNANCKFIIGLTTSSGNDVNGSGANYGATSNWKTYLENTYKIRKYYLTLLTEFPNIRIATPNLYLDRYYGYAFGTRKISNRYQVDEQYHANYVHPAPSGYNQMGDAYLACYVGVLTE
jgi:hypothetical protein